MGIKTILLSLICCFILSCDKDGDTEGDKSENDPDEILYFDIEPDRQIASVNYFTPSLVEIFDCKDMPTPADSTIFYDVDLDIDGQNDFRFTISHGLYSDGYCGHCAVFTYRMSISSLSSLDSVAISNSDYSIVKIFEPSDTISMNELWSERAQIKLTEGCVLPFQTDFEDGFIGVKMGDTYGYIQIEKIPHNGISIMAHGYNKTNSYETSPKFSDHCNSLLLHCK